MFQFIRKKERFQDFIRVASIYHRLPQLYAPKRHIGIALALTGWVLIALYTTFFQSLSTVSFTSNLFGFTYFHAAAFSVFFLLCLRKGKGYLKCVNTKMVVLRAVLAVVSFGTYSLSKIWSQQVDGALLYNTDMVWIALILLFSSVKIHRLSWLGMLISLTGIAFISQHSLCSLESFWGSFCGLISGLSLAGLTLITHYVIRKDSPLRVGCYHTGIGFLTSLCCLIAFSFFQPMQLPGVKETFIMLFSGGLFSIALFCFLQAAFYVEAYVLGVLSYSVIIFSHAFHWILNGEIPLPPLTIGSLLIIIGGLKVVLGVYLRDGRKSLTLVRGGTKGRTVCNV